MRQFVASKNWKVKAVLCLYLWVHFCVWSITFKNISEELNGHNSCSWPNGATTLIRRYLTKVGIPLSKKPFEKLSVLKPMEFDRSMEHLEKWISFSKSDLLMVQKHVFAQHTNSARNFKNLIIKDAIIIKEKFVLYKIL